MYNMYGTLFAVPVRTCPCVTKTKSVEKNILHAERKSCLIFFHFYCSGTRTPYTNEYGTMRKDLLV